MLAHELRNPLAAIGSAGAVLEAVPEGAPAAAKARGIVVRQTRHLRPPRRRPAGRAPGFNTGKIRIVRTTVDLAELVERCVHVVWPEPSSHEVAIDTEPVWVEGDVTRLEQVFGNLLANARKFTPEGGRVTVTLRREDGEAVATVEDTGEGMPPDLVPRVFDLFVQGDRHLDRSAGGLGIGLNLARHLVELHGGSIHAASAGPGRGSTFEVRLPAAAAPRRAPTEAPAPAPGPRPSVLLVEDGADVRDSLAELLRHRGHSVHCAADGPAALARFAEVHPDVVLLDLGLPGMDGLEVAQRMRAATAGDLPLIALTGYGAEADRQRTAAAGFLAHLVKPIVPAELFRLLER